MASSEAENFEEKLTSLLGQLHLESGILHKMIYKNKNQHRRGSYFRYLLQVGRDLRLLQATKLEDLVSSCFQVIGGKKPKQKIHLLESLKRRKCEVGKYNFMERLLGAARLLSEMVEPIFKAATYPFLSIGIMLYGYVGVACYFLFAQIHYSFFVNLQNGVRWSFSIAIQLASLHYTVLFIKASLFYLLKLSIKLLDKKIQYVTSCFPNHKRHLIGLHSLPSDLAREMP